MNERKQTPSLNTS